MYFGTWQSSIGFIFLGPTEIPSVVELMLDALIYSHIAIVLVPKDCGLYLKNWSDSLLCEGFELCYFQNLVIEGYKCELDKF